MPSEAGTGVVGGGTIPKMESRRLFLVQGTSRMREDRNMAGFNKGHTGFTCEPKYYSCIARDTRAAFN